MGWNPLIGSGGIRTASITLTSAQLLAIFTTPVTIVPAPGAGLAVIPTGSWTFDYIAGSTPYTDGGGALIFQWGSANGVGYTLTTLGWWNQATSQTKIAGSGQSTARGSAAIANQPLVVAQNTANPTLGNGTVTITGRYYLVAVS